MLDSFAFLSGFIWGAAIAGALIVWLFDVSKKPTYRWVCPVEGCHFVISSTHDHEIVLRISENHALTHGDK